MQIASIKTVMFLILYMITPNIGVKSPFRLKKISWEVCIKRMRRVLSLASFEFRHKIHYYLAENFLAFFNVLCLCV